MTLLAAADHRFLAAPLWLITALHVLTLTLHLVAMNCMLGGIVFVLFGPRRDRWGDPVVRRLVKLFPTIMAATVTLGVAPLLFLQLVYGQVVYAASITSGWFWFLVPFTAMVAYYFLYAGAFQKEPDARTGRWLGLALVGLLFISFVYSTVFALAERPEAIASLYAGTQSGLAIFPEVGSWLLRWLHMLLGALAVGAFFVGAVSRREEAVFEASKRLFLGATVLAMVAGLAYLLTLGESLPLLMRRAGIYLLFGGILLSLAALHLVFRGRRALAGGALLLSVLAMVATRHDLRLLTLGDRFDPAAPPVKGQWDVFALFLVCFVVALGLVAWMLRLFFAKERPAGA